MIDVFIPFQGFLKIENVCTDNSVFRMHYKLTVVILLLSTLLVTSKQLFGEPIHCIGHEKDYKEAMNNYCWIYGTYTVRSALDGKPGKHYAHPGVGPDGAPGDVIYHTYYQWVCFVLLLQAAMFYFPHYLWKVWESGRIRSLAADLGGAMMPKEWSAERRSDLINYLTHSNIFQHNIYALRFAFCELLNLVNVVAQIFLLNLFLGGSFLTYGSAVAAFNYRPDLHRDLQSGHPMARYFPKVTKCRFNYYGSSGGINEKDLLCVLPINIINEKLFVFLWFWLVFLALLSALAFLHRLLVFSLAPLRTLFLLGQIRYVKRRYVANVVRRFYFGDWFLLYQLGKNLNPRVYKELIVELSKTLEHKAVVM